MYKCVCMYAYMYVHTVTLWLTEYEQGGPKPPPHRKEFLVTIHMNL